MNVVEMYIFNSVNGKTIFNSSVNVITFSYCISPRTTLQVWLTAGSRH